MTAWTRVTAPAVEPINLIAAKAQARITHENSDELLSGYITMAREAAEDYMARGLFTQTWQLVRDRFADVMSLPMAAPLQNDALASPSTAPVVQYYDVNGVLQTLATTFYTVDTVSRPGRIVRAPAQAWPALQADRLSGAVLITYVVGWTDVADIPERIKQGIKMYVAYLDADREGMHDYAAQARASAEACWSDRVYYVERCDELAYS
jgi:uncharacterized phiE125 gp8 family phage protein